MLVIAVYWRLSENEFDITNNQKNFTAWSSTIWGYAGDNRLWWWRHQMETFSALLVICAGNSPVAGEFSAQRPVTRSFDVFFDLRLNKLLSKQSSGWWFNTLSRPLWRHCNVFRVVINSVDAIRWKSLLNSKDWLRWELGTIRQQAITWANAVQDLYRYIMSLGDNAFRIINLKQCIEYVRELRNCNVGISIQYRLSMRFCIFIIIISCTVNKFSQ